MTAGWLRHTLPYGRSWAGSRNFEHLFQARDFWPKESLAEHVLGKQAAETASCADCESEASEDSEGIATYVIIF